MQPKDHTEGTLREQLAAYFLTAPPLAEQTPSQRQEYLHQLERLGRLERQDLCRPTAAARPLVWGNPAPLIQSLLSAVQRLGARLGQPILLFPARDTAIGSDTLLHPRMLSVAVCHLLYRACAAAPRQPVWVRLQEQAGGLAVAVTATLPFADAATVALIKECTKLHDGSLVHCDESFVFSCGQASHPPAGVRLYSTPDEKELLQDTLSPVWSVFYAPLYSSDSSSTGSISSTSESSSTGADQTGASSSTGDANTGG